MRQSLFFLDMGWWRRAQSSGRGELIRAIRSGLLSRAEISSTVLLRFFVFLLCLNALDAYDVWRIPLQWIMQLAVIISVAYFANRTRLPKPLGAGSLWVLFGLSLVVTAINSMFGHYSGEMPTGSTTPYLLFIALRFLTILFFIASLYYVYWLLQRGLGKQLMTATVVVGTIVSVVALYIYMAQLYGLPEPPRTRLGTSGGLQAVRFTYDFHRATGTFREPSLLAAWLMVPLLLCLTLRGFWPYVLGAVIGGAVLLTGSLSAIVAIAVGSIVAIALMVAADPKSARNLVRALVVLPFALGIFYLLARSNTSHGVNLFGTLGDRVGVIFKGGLGQSDRNLVYGYVAHTFPPLFGFGLGNANILLAHYLGTKVVASFISLYLDTLYASGLLGIIVLASFVLRPVIKVLRRPILRRNSRMLVLIAPYLAWLVVFAVAAEEFTFMFAVICALLSYEIWTHTNSSDPGIGLSLGGARRP